MADKTLGEQSKDESAAYNAENDGERWRIVVVAPPGGWDYRRSEEPDRYRIVAVIGGVRFASEQTYDYADAFRLASGVERDADGYVSVVRVNRTPPMIRYACGRQR
jgi:hypothetical protein